MAGPVSDGLVPRRGKALLGVPAAEAAALHDQVVDGKVARGQRLARRGGGGGDFGLARARLALQQPDANVGNPQLLLALQAKRVQRLPLGEGAVDHLRGSGVGGRCSK